MNTIRIYSSGNSPDLKGVGRIPIPPGYWVVEVEERLLVAIVKRLCEEEDATLFVSLGRRTSNTKERPIVSYHAPAYIIEKAEALRTTTAAA